MPSSNPIIALAERALEERFSGERRRQEFEALITRGIDGQDVYEALQTVRTPACPTPLVEVVANICMDLASAAGQDELVAVTHFHVGDILSKRYDRLSLELAIQHFQVARRGWNPRNPNYGSAQMNEGAARGRLAELGVEPRVHLETAAALCKAARHSFAPRSPEAGRAQLNEGIARLMLAEYGNDPIESVQAAVVLYQDARECLVLRLPIMAGRWRREDVHGTSWQR